MSDKLCIHCGSDCKCFFRNGIFCKSTPCSWDEVNKGNGCSTQGKSGYQFIMDFMKMAQGVKR